MSSDIDYDDSAYEGGYYAYFVQESHPPHDYYEVEPHVIDEAPGIHYRRYWITPKFTIDDALTELNGHSLWQ